MFGHVRWYAASGKGRLSPQHVDWNCMLQSMSFVLVLSMCLSVCACMWVCACLSVCLCLCLCECTPERAPRQPAGHEETTRRPQAKRSAGDHGTPEQYQQTDTTAKLQEHSRNASPKCSEFGSTPEMLPPSAGGFRSTHATRSSNTGGIEGSGTNISPPHDSG